MSAGLDGEAPGRSRGGRGARGSGGEAVPPLSAAAALRLRGGGGGAGRGSAGSSRRGGVASSRGDRAAALRSLGARLARRVCASEAVRSRGCEPQRARGARRVQRARGRHAPALWAPAAAPAGAAREAAVARPCGPALTRFIGLAHERRLRCGGERRVSGAQTAVMGLRMARRKAATRLRGATRGESDSAAAASAAAPPTAAPCGQALRPPALQLRPAGDSGRARAVACVPPAPFEKVLAASKLTRVRFPVSSFAFRFQREQETPGSAFSPRVRVSSALRPSQAAASSCPHHRAPLSAPQQHALAPASLRSTLTPRLRCRPVAAPALRGCCPPAATRPPRCAAPAAWRLRQSRAPLPLPPRPPCPPRHRLSAAAVVRRRCTTATSA